MKRLILLLLAAALTLVGCAKENGQETTAPIPPTEPTPGLYDPDNLAEQQSQGAVRAYPIGSDAVNGIQPMGEDILVFCTAQEGHVTTLIRLEGENMGEAARVTLDCLISPTDPHVRVSYSQMAYYNEENNSVVFLDSNLEEARRVQMPDNMLCPPVVSQDMQRVYYCVDSEIRVMELGSGISRLLKQHSCQDQILKALHFNETVLEVEVIGEEGSYVAFVSTENGETLGSDKTLISAASAGDAWLILRTEGVTQEVLVGSLGEEPRSLTGCEYTKIYSTLSMDSVVTLHPQEGLSMYSLSTGQRTAAMWYDGVDRIYQLVSDPYGQYVWFLGQDPKGRADTLYRWEPAKSPVTDDTVYIGQRFTAQAPDTQGLAACREWADRLEQTYGVEIILESGLVQPADHELTGEYLTEAFQLGLAELESAMSAFPEGFFVTLGSVTSSGKLNIVLVREITPLTANAIQEPVGLQYWVGTEAYIALVANSALAGNFYHELSYALDTYVFAYSVRYDDWQTLNPEGFQYDSNFVDYLTREDSKYLTDGDRAFVNAASMTYPREDRAAIFQCAMAPGNAALFETQIMQAKLKTICDGIRDAFGWKNSEETFLWEQYLKTE